MSYIKSPIIYQGNKFRLIKEIFSCIPNDINNFYDLFGGSGTISINAQKIAKNVFYNELNNNIFNMFSLLTRKEDIISHMRERERVRTL